MLYRHPPGSPRLRERRGTGRRPVGGIVQDLYVEAIPRIALRTSCIHESVDNMDFVIDGQLNCNTGELGLRPRMPNRRSRPPGEQEQVGPMQGEG